MRMDASQRRCGGFEHSMSKNERMDRCAITNHCVDQIELSREVTRVPQPFPYDACFDSLQERAVGANVNSYTRGIRGAMCNH